MTGKSKAAKAHMDRSGTCRPCGRRAGRTNKRLTTDLADTGVADEKELEEIVVFAGVHGVLAKRRRE